MSLKGIFGLFGMPEDDSDMNGVDEVGEIMMYNRALSWIQDCDLKKDEWKLAFHDHKEKDILECIIKSIKYYEKIEEYETCAFLKKIQNCVEEIYP